MSIGSVRIVSGVSLIGLILMLVDLAASPYEANPECDEFAPICDTPQPVPWPCLLYTSPSPRDRTRSRMPSSA